MLILLPPSEGKTAARRGRPLDLGTLSFPALTEPRARVIDALVDLCEGSPEDAARTLGIGSTQLDLVRLDRELRTTPTQRADHTYTGVLYDALDVGSLKGAAAARAHARLAVGSALFGLLRAFG